MYARILLSATLALCLAAPFAWGDEDDSGSMEPSELVSVLREIKPSFVRVQYWLQMDKGEEPDATGTRYRCPNCGNWHYTGGGSSTIKEERPLETMGVLIAPDRVLTADMMTHPRFIRTVKVRFGDSVVPASMGQIGVDNQARILKLSKPLEGGKPLEFDSSLEGPYLLANYARSDGRWTLGAGPFAPSAGLREDGTAFASSDQAGLVIDTEGRAVGALFNTELPLDGSWKGNPRKAWTFMPQSEYEQLTSEVQRKADAGLLRVVMNFRSPPKQDDDTYGMSYGPHEENDNATEKYGVGVLLSETRLLVLTSLAPKVTARLKKITVHAPEGKTVGADFDGSLKDYGAFFAELRQPLSGALVTTGHENAQLGELLPCVRLRLRGGKREAQVSHTRYGGAEVGYKAQLTPEFAGNEEHRFMFSREGRLLAMPLARRQGPGEDSYRYYGRSEARFAQLLDRLTEDLAAAIDPSNRPLSEAEEARLAWMGVELQPMTPELARANEVSHLSSDGQTGAIVSYVYDDSPADKAGVKVDDVLLRLHVEDRPAPLEVRIERSYGFGAQDFPWDRLDSLPEELFDRVPKPWPSAENRLNRLLTDIGFGRKYTAEFFVNGETVKREFKVVESPEHYGSTPKHESEALGLTLRDLTYEVQRYFHLGPDDAGLIISKIKPGSKAAVSGLKPYEIVTEVNGQPVRTLADFREAVEGQAELRLAVKRMNQSRVVRVAVPRPTTGPASE